MPKERADQNQLSYQEFDALERHHMTTEGEIPGIEEFEKKIISDGINGDKIEIETRTQVFFRGIGKNRKAVTVFIPNDRKVLDEMIRS